MSGHETSPTRGAGGAGGVRGKGLLARLWHESGLASLRQTGRDALLVILSRTTRMFAFGAASLTLALFFAELGFSDFRIGLFLTLTLVGDVLLGLAVTLMADGLGRRRVLVAGGLLMALSGAAFSVFESFWVLLLAAVVGVVSASGGDFGPFRAIEESTLSHITTPKTRADVLSWYVAASSLGSALGPEVAGRLVDGLSKGKGWDLVQAYHATFWVYIVMGCLNVVFALSLSSKCELSGGEKDVAAAAVAAAARDGTSRHDDDELAQGLLDDNDYDNRSNAGSDNAHVASEQQQQQQQPKPKTSRFSQISPSTRATMYKLWFLLTVDTLADGMVSQTLTIYFMQRKFGSQVDTSSLGDVMSTAMVLATVGALFAGPLSRHLGLLNTMVFTHIPSSAAVLLFPFPHGLALTSALLYLRMGLNPMDQAPRAAFIAAVVRPEERTAVMGITSTLRTCAMAVGPSLTGGLAQTDRFWIAFLVGGSLRLLYDLGLWAMFVNLKLHAHEEDGGDEQQQQQQGGESVFGDEEAAAELHPQRASTSTDVQR
ncbi:hypothetical protein N3K66_001587 [Trichothecium roseum]|uniref:Uncharacterized protein n=1 Tax=Trichothecium roseum TaxID=47278 RepID=A0ACC0VH13_9HYPO|nr:hypothetical protein N3K66_001587 [Trichothecium roseum]